MLSDNSDLTFWRQLYRKGAEWVATGVAHLVGPPFATGTYPAWYTAAMRTSARLQAMAGLNTKRPNPTSGTTLFEFIIDTSAPAVRHRLALSNVQGGSDDRVRDKTSGPSH